MKGRPPRGGATKARLAIKQAVQAIKPARKARQEGTRRRAAPTTALPRSDAQSDLASETPTLCMSTKSLLSDTQESSVPSALADAVTDVVANNASVRRAATVHGLARATLHRAVQAYKYVSTLC